MELRQLRYFVKVCELGSLGRAALDLGLATSALSQQISRLEGELSTRLLQRASTGVTPTDAGLAFLQQAQLTLRHADEAVRAAQQARLSGHVSIGLPPTTASVVGLPLMQAMSMQYPDIRLHLVEALSGHLASSLNARLLDMAILFRADLARRWSVTPLLNERLYVIGASSLAQIPKADGVLLAQLGELPLILPSSTHGLRILIDSSFAQARIVPRVIAEIDGLTLLMDAVRAGHGATIQPGAATARLGEVPLVQTVITDSQAARRNLLASLSTEELSPAALASRAVLIDVVRALVCEGRWAGASLLEN